MMCVGFTASALRTSGMVLVLVLVRALVLVPRRQAHLRRPQLLLFVL
jgi:hypothetical protein